MSPHDYLLFLLILLLAGIQIPHRFFLSKPAIETTGIVASSSGFNTIQEPDTEL